MKSLQSMVDIASFVPNDARYPRQWGLNNDSVTVKNAFPSAPAAVGADINMEKAWDCEQGDTNVVVVILDTGCKLDHPDLDDRIWVNHGEIPGDNIDNDNNGYIDDVKGWDFRNQDNDPTDIDPAGHGTGITSIVGAEGNNLEGLTGVDLNCKLMIVKFLDTLFSSITISDLDDAIRYSTDNGGDVINFSYTYGVNNLTIAEGIKYAYDNDVVFVSITGNDDQQLNLYPASYPDSIGVLAVGATDPDDSRAAPFITGGGSNYTPFIDVCAPGNYILVPDNLTDTAYFSIGGTSASAAYVSGLAALLKAQDTARVADTIVSIIKHTADDQVGIASEDSPGFDIFHGHGRINAERALCNTNSRSDLMVSNENIRLFPNPSNGLVKGEIIGIPVKSIRILLYDVQGRSLHTETVISSTRFELMLPQQGGLYFYEVIVNDRFRGTGKLVKAG
jgi:subtilisin family serine protease